MEDMCIFCFVSWHTISCRIAFVAKKSGLSDETLNVFVPDCWLIVVFLFWSNSSFLFVFTYAFLRVLFLAGCREKFLSFFVGGGVVDYSVWTFALLGSAVFFVVC